MSDRRRGMRNRLVVMTAVAAFALAVGGLAVVAARSGGDGPAGPSTGRALPRLPFESDAAPAAMARSQLSPMPGALRYRLDPGVQQPATSARAYRLGAVTDSQMSALAHAVGVKGEPTTAQGRWVVDDGAHMLSVEQSTGRWYFAATPSTAVAVPGMEATSGAILCAPCPPGRVCAQTCQPPARPAGTPTREEAEQTARVFWARVGVDPAGSPVAADDGFSQWNVHFSPTVDGTTALAIDQSVVVGVNRVIESASGWLGRPRLLGEYPLVTLAEAVDRLNTEGAGPGCRNSVPRCETPMQAGTGPAVTSEPTAGSTGSPGSACMRGGEPTTAVPPPGCQEPTTDPRTTTSINKGAPPPVTETTVRGDGATPILRPNQPADLLLTITGVRLQLMAVDDYLVPVYLFTLAEQVNGGQVAPVPAVPDRLLMLRGPGGSGTGGGSGVGGVGGSGVGKVEQGREPQTTGPGTDAPAPAGN